MATLNGEFAIGSNPYGVPPIVMNNVPPMPSPIKPDDFNGAHPKPWTSNANIANPPTNRTHDFKTPMAKEDIPTKASISGTV
jgi:hypothetical protein